MSIQKNKTDEEYRKMDDKMIFHNKKTTFFCGSSVKSVKNKPDMVVCTWNNSLALTEEQFLIRYLVCNKNP
jgi:hypothetical protein